MDPEATYSELADLTHQVLVGVEVDAVRMAELFEALDGWIRTGGVLPRNWQQK